MTPFLALVIGMIAGELAAVLFVVEAFFEEGSPEYRRCLANIDELERELLPHLFPPAKPSNYTQVNPAFVAISPGEKWIVEDPADVRLYTPMQQAIIDTNLKIEAAMAARGLIHSGIARQREVLGLPEERMDG